MAHAAPPPPLFCLQLQAGQHAWEYLPRAARITVTEGSIVVHQRLWLAGSWVHVPVTVRAEEQFQATAGGWVEMEAVTATQVRANVVPAWWREKRWRLALKRFSVLRAKKQAPKLPQAV